MGFVRYLESRPRKLPNDCYEPYEPYDSYESYESSDEESCLPTENWSGEGARLFPYPPSQLIPQSQSSTSTQQVGNQGTGSREDATQIHGSANHLGGFECRPKGINHQFDSRSRNVVDEPLVIVHIGSEELEFSNRVDLLQYFWGHGPESNCMVCGEPFDDQKGPPLRTVSLEEVGIFRGLPTTVTHAIRVYNRHLCCVEKFAVNFLAVSHVWDSSIAKAHCERLELQEAAACLYEVISRMLPSATAKFSHLYKPVELWHDYFSIPQWNYNVQQRLLVSLPDIFGIAPMCIVHLDDVSSSCFRRKVADLGSPAQAQRFEELATFFRARWFQRMWVSLEYAKCNRACIYTMEGDIIHGDGQFLQDSFSSYLEGFQQEIRSMISSVDGYIFQSLFKRLPMPVIGLFADMRRNLKTPQPILSFGEAIDFIAARECRDYGDRFVAMCGFLRLVSHAEIPSGFSKNPTNACLWLARRSLEHGDYSPLLVLGDRYEQEVAGANWLIGHRNMSFGMWGLGSLTSQPERQIIVQDDRISLDVDYIGSLDSLYRIPRTDDTTIFSQIVSFILSDPLYRSAALFVAALGRIYAVPPVLHSPGMPLELVDYIRIQPDFVERLEMLLDEYVLARSNNQSVIFQSAQCQRISVALIVLLRLSQPFHGSLRSYSRLTQLPLHTRLSPGYEDAVAFVRCCGCNQRFPYCFSLLGRKLRDPKLYRIPGLAYTLSSPNGIGLVISEKRIVGRMVSGSPACSCRTREVVELK
ncbi:hypothetical protein BGZ57DRAFT_441988 [Hyaloscypha finlandica]|nr:hypothetical protein BGZ57DRAFT_441988 [Hyaloscypha finlandica]